MTVSGISDKTGALLSIDASTGKPCSPVVGCFTKLVTFLDIVICVLYAGGIIF